MVGLDFFLTLYFINTHTHTIYCKTAVNWKADLCLRCPVLPIPALSYPKIIQEGSSLNFKDVSKPMFLLHFVILKESLNVP